MTTTAVSNTMTLDITGVGPVQMTVEEQGTGQPFLLLHGGAGPTSVTRLAQLLAERNANRVLAPIHPGFGGTRVQLNSAAFPGFTRLYIALVDELGLEGVTIIGNSVGGWIAAEMATLGSPRIRSIALLDAVGIEVDGHPLADVSGLSVPEIQSLSFHDPALFRVDPSTLPDAQKAIMAANGATLAVYAGTPPMVDPTLLSRLGDISIPTIVLWGESDRIVEPAYGPAYAAAIPGSRFEVLPATGHLPQMESPELVLQRIGH